MSPWSRYSGGSRRDVTTSRSDVDVKLVGDERSIVYDSQSAIPISASVFAVCVDLAGGVAPRRTGPSMAPPSAPSSPYPSPLRRLLGRKLAAPLTVNSPHRRADFLAGGGARELSKVDVCLVERRLDDRNLRGLIGGQPGERFWTFRGIESARLPGSASAYITIVHHCVSRGAA